MRAFDCFYQTDFRGLPAIVLVSLLPKMDGVVNIKDFRMVSLIHGVIKIFYKVLSIRLAEDLPQLVGILQSAFVKEWSIHDNFMLAQCSAWRLHALKNPAVILKFDILKVFDTTQWSFRK